MSLSLLSVDDAMHTVRNLRTKDFTVQNLDDELACMTLIRALPVEQFAAFRSTLLLQSDITMETLRSAFQLEEENRRPSASAMALAASTSVSANAAVAGSCYYCGKPGHQQTECSLYIKGQKSARAGNNYTSRHKPRNKGKASGHGTSSANLAEKSAANASVPPSLSLTLGMQTQAPLHT